MRCKACDYPLWNLPARRCPECGAAFKPSDFEFTINSVQFCCPHCRQPYYGTGERGHLVPSKFDCVNCGQRVDMDEMVLLPTEGVKEEQTVVDSMPWLERGKGISGPKAWWLTVWRGMSSPTRLMRATPLESSGGAAVWFGLTVNMLGLVLGMGVMIVFFLIVGMGAGGRMGGGGPFMILGLASMLLGWVVSVAVMLAVWGLLTHALLCLGGKRAGTLARTYQALGYSAGPMIICAIPCLGVYLSLVGWIWWMIGATFMLKEGQK